MPHTIINRREPATTTRLILGPKKNIQHYKLHSKLLALKKGLPDFNDSGTASHSHIYNSSAHSCPTVTERWRSFRHLRGIGFAYLFPAYLVYIQHVQIPAFFLGDSKFLHSFTVAFSFCCRCQSSCTTTVRQIKVKACPKKKSELLHSPYPVSMLKSRLSYLSSTVFGRHIAIE